MFLKKYGSLSIYDEDLKKRFIIDLEKLQFNKNDDWTFIIIPEETDVLMIDHDYFYINEDNFDRFQSTHQKNNISLRIISNELIGKTINIRQHISVLKIFEELNTV